MAQVPQLEPRGGGRMKPWVGVPPKPEPKPDDGDCPMAYMPETTLQGGGARRSGCQNGLLYCRCLRRRSRLQSFLVESKIAA